MPRRASTAGRSDTTARSPTAGSLLVIWPASSLSPGIIDSGYWDGPGKEEFLADVAAKNPARRIGQPSDVSAAAITALTNPFITGTTLHVDGGGRLA